MSEIRVDKLKGENGSSTVELTTGATIPSGKTVVGAGADFTIRNLTGVAATFSGQVTYEDVTNIDSVGVVTARGGLNVVGGGATITGVTTFFNDLRAKGVIENVSAATTFLDANSKVVLELDLLASTTYSYAMQPANIGVVSFKNMPADAQGWNNSYSSIHSSICNHWWCRKYTTFGVGLGTDCTVIPSVNGCCSNWYFY